MSVSNSWAEFAGLFRSTRQAFVEHERSKAELKALMSEDAKQAADYDAQSAVERELVLRLASILWRLRRATTMETGLFEIQGQHLRDYRQNCRVAPKSHDVIHASFPRGDSTSLYGVLAQCRE
jgi:hypothetical protein